MHISVATDVTHSMGVANYLYGVYGLASYIFRNSKRRVSSSWLGFKEPYDRGSYRIQGNRRLEIRFPAPTLTKQISIPMMLLAVKMARDINIIKNMLGSVNERRMYYYIENTPQANESKRYARHVALGDNTSALMYAKLMSQLTGEDEEIIFNMIKSLAKKCTEE